MSFMTDYGSVSERNPFTDDSTVYRSSIPELPSIFQQDHEAQDVRVGQYGFQSEQDHEDPAGRVKEGKYGFQSEQDHEDPAGRVKEGKYGFQSEQDHEDPAGRVKEGQCGFQSEQDHEDQAGRMKEGQYGFQSIANQDDTAAGQSVATGPTSNGVQLSDAADSTAVSGRRWNPNQLSQNPAHLGKDMFFPVEGELLKVLN